MKYEPPKDGVHRDYYQNGQIQSEYTIKNGKLDGISRDWHENGQLAHEFSRVRGKLCCRMRCWDLTGMFIVQMFYFDDRQISKKRYDEKCRRDPSLPRFEDKKPTNNVGNFIRHLRREQREQAKSGTTPEQVQYQKWFDEQRKADSKLKSSSEAIRWLKTHGEKELGEMTKQEALRLVRKLYSNGAVKIWAIGIEHDSDGSEYSRELIVKLPKDAQKRGKIYNLCIDPARPADSGPAIFTGRDYMSVSLL